MRTADWQAEIQLHMGRAPALLREILGQFKLDLDGIHGVSHWMRVHANGVRLAASTGADVDVITWFALLHDCCRFSNWSDPDHGPRAAMFARAHRQEIDLGQPQFDLLLGAVTCHTVGCSSTADVTIRTCLDADRLDIGRVGVAPLARLLFTDEARREVQGTQRRKGHAP